MAEDVVPCLSVKVSGAASQPVCNGKYHIDEKYKMQCSGRQAWSLYKQDEENAVGFIYYLEDGYDGSVIG